MAVGRITGNFDVQIMDAAGTAPLANGKLYFYTAGTTTPKNTYPTKADAIAGTNANANPVILNSAGRPSSGGNIIEMWLLTDEMYKVVIKTSADVTVRTIDNYSGAYEPLNESASSDLQFADNTGLQDANSNEVLDILKATSAVNYFTMQNAATGVAPALRSAGDDANVGMIIATKGSGTLAVTGNTTITGTETVSGATTLQSTLSVTGAASFSSTLSAGALSTSSTLSVSGATTVAALTASGTITANGALNVGTTAMAVNAANAFWATAGVMETGTSASTAVTPAVQQRHKGHPKAWVVCGVTANIGDSYNVTSVGDTGTGIATINLTTNFSGSSYCIVYTPLAASVSVYGQVSSKAADNFVLRCKGGGGTTDTDPDLHCAVAFGDQA